jgi:hypothetical protein
MAGGSRMLSTGRESNLSPRAARTPGGRRGLLAGVAFGLLAPLGACAAGTSSATGPGASPSGPAGGLFAGGGSDAVRLPHATAPSSSATLVGTRCHDGHCTCRKGGRDDAENPPPDADHKRFEIRVGVDDGDAALESPTLGRFTGGGPGEGCFYIDVLPGTHHMLTFAAREGQPRAGLSPSLRIAEYGPKGPYWYDVVDVHCAGAGDKCTRDAADAWGTEARTRKRGRIDPCGSSVVTHLVWQTSGGTGDIDGGRFRDFSVTFEMEVKRFATQFAPGATECVPK